LAIFIDAIDNAEVAANQRTDDCFPIKLLESFDTNPISNVKLIVSCRTERKPKTFARFKEFSLLPFTRLETRLFLETRLADVTDAEINIAHVRSGGNARVLDYLVNAGRGMLLPSEL